MIPFPVFVAGYIIYRTSRRRHSLLRSVSWHQKLLRPASGLSSSQQARSLRSTGHTEKSPRRRSSSCRTSALCCSSCSSAAARGGAKAGVWVVTALLAAVFSWRVSALMPWPVDAIIWVMAASTVLGGFYALFLHHPGVDWKWSIDRSTCWSNGTVNSCVNIVTYWLLAIGYCKCLVLSTHVYIHI